MQCESCPLANTIKISLRTLLMISYKARKLSFSMCWKKAEWMSFVLLNPKVHEGKHAKLFYPQHERGTAKYPTEKACPKNRKKREKEREREREQARSMLYPESPFLRCCFLSRCRRRRRFLLYSFLPSHAAIGRLSMKTGSFSLSPTPEAFGEGSASRQSKDTE